MADFTLTAGIDDFTGPIGEDNVFSGLTADLSSDDRVRGAQVPVFEDRLVLSGGGDVSALDLSGVSAIERVDLEDATNIVLVDAFVTTSNASRFEIRASNGADLIDASALTEASGNMRVVLSSGDTTYLAGSNNTLVNFGAGELTSGDVFVGGPGVNTLSANEAVILTAADIANFSEIKALTFREGGSIELIDGFGRDGTTRVISRSDQDISVDGSAIVTDKLRLVAGGGDDTLIGGALRDRFYFDIDEGELNSDDIVDGGGGFDFLILEGTGSLTAADMVGVTNIPIIKMGNGNISIELSDTLTDRNAISVEARTGTQFVDGSGLEDTAVRVEFRTGTSTFLGGSKNDQVSLTATRLGEEDTFDGGAGSDELVITTFSRISAEELVSVTNFEELTFVEGSIFTLTDNFTTGDSLTINLSDGVEQIDAAFETSAEILFDGVDAGDILTGGGSSDTFVLSSGDFERIDGGGGDFNRIVLGETLSDVDLTEAAAQALLSSIQVVELSAAAGALAVDAAAVSAISGVGQELFIIGQAADQVDIRGVWTSEGTRNVPELSETPFDVYTSSTGETLLVLQGVQTTVTIGTGPTDLDLSNSSIAENDDGGVIGAITVTDPDIDDTHTFEVDDARFEVVDGNLQLKEGISLDRETTASVDVLVTAADAAGASYSETFTIAVTDVNEFGVTAPVDTDAAANTVAENAAAGTATGITVSASDADATMNGVSFTVDDDRFEVNGAGELVVAAGAVIDRESEASIDVVVTATSEDGSDETTSFTIAVTDENEFGVTAPVDGDAAANSVAENAAAGTATGITVSASDADATMNGVTFTTDDARFEVNGDGQLVVAAGAVIDRESEASIDVVVTATSEDGSDETTSFTIAVTDENEFGVTAPVDGDAAANSVAENAAAGTATGITVSASDADATMNGVSFTVDDDRFEVNGAGELVVAAGAVIDRESEASIDVVVTATSADGSDETTSFTIAVTDENEFGVTAPVDGDAAANSVAENAAAGTATGITVSASDADATMNGVTFTTNDARFEVNGDGQLVVAAGAVIDRESEASIDVVVTATSEDGSDETTSFTIAVTDENEFGVTAPVDGDAAANSVAENAAAGATTGVTVSASDADATMNGVSFTVDDDRFEVNGAGELVVAAGAVIDRESEASIDVVVTATSADGSDETTSFTIAVTDENEFGVTAPVDGDAAANSVAENAAAGATTGVTVSASDADATMNGVSFTVDDDRFEVNGAGELVVAAGAVIDRESEASIDVVVTATSADGSDETTSFTIAVTDENEFGVTAPVDGDAAANSVAENAAAGTATGITVSASDADATMNGVTFTTDDARFEVNGDGQLVVAAGAVIDRESEASIDVVVTATSEDGSDETTSFTIAVTDENDNAPQITSAATGSVDEGGQSVLTLTADDADITGEPTVFSISGGADAALFEIVGGSELRFISEPDFEAAADVGGDNSYDVTIQASDGTNSSTQAITVTVNDVNEAPTVSLTQTATDVDENTDVSAGLKVADISVSDDALGTNSLSLSGADSGRFEIRGSELFFVGSAPDFETQSSYDVSVDVDDAGIVGAPDGSSALTLDINDVNEAPVAVGDTANAVEDVLVAPTGNLLGNDSDVDGGQDLNVFSVNGNITVVAGDLIATGIYGDLVVDADSGEFTYTLNSTTAQSLAAGQVVTDTFTYVAADDGTPVQTASSSLVVTVTGTNDQPIARADTASVTEDVTLAASGNVISDTRGANAQGAGDTTDTDVDATDVLTVVAVNGLPGNVGGVVEGIYGNMTVGANGDYTYTLGVTVAQQATVDALREGDAPVETFTYTVRDSAGDTDATTLKVTVNGTNDIPTLSVAPLARTLTSGQADVIASNATVADPDNDISVITVSLDVSANSNAADTALDSADVLGFDGSFQTFLTSQGFTVEGGTNGDDLVITAPDGEPLGNTFAEAILEQIKYTAGDSSFGFNANDRVVSVTLTDIVGASSTPVQITVDMQADVSDGAGASAFVGGNLADTVFGGAGDDTITGLEGDDEIDGGDDTDTAVYQGDLSGYTVSTTADASGFVTSFDRVEDIDTGDTDEGTDTLNSVEVLEFNDQTVTLTKAVQLFSGAPGTGNLAGTFDTIQAAIDAAEAGDTILVNGTGGPGGTVYAASESLSIDKGVTIEGLGAVSVVSITVSGGGAGQVVDIDNLDVAAASVASSAVQIDESATYDSVTFQNGDVTGGTQHGLLVGSGSNPVVAATTASNVASIVIENANFSGNGTAPSYGAGGLTFFGYNNDLTLTDVSVTGGMGTYNGIQLRGLDQLASAGAVVLEGVAITGAFVNTGMAIYNFADLAGFDLAGGDPDGSLDIDVSAAFAGLNIDNVGGDVDLAASAGLTVSNGSLGAPDINVNAAAGNVGNLLTGDASNDILSGNGGDDDLQGNAGSDILLGGAGADALSGGAGDDTFIQFVGEGASDGISGGSEADTVALLDNAAADDAVGAVYDGSSLTTLDGATLSGVETVTAHVDTGLAGGGTLAPLVGDTGIDTLSYAGTTAAVTVDLEQGTASGFGVNPLLSFAGAPNSAISGFENVTGGAGDDSLDGDTGANVIDGGAGLDTTQYDGTVLASQFTATATGWQVATIAEGMDTLEGIERVEHADGAILLVGNGGYTSIQDAIDAAANGDTILVAPGIYDEDLALDVAVNIIGISGDASDVTIGSVRIGSSLTGADVLTIEIANITVDAAQGSAASGVVYAGSYDGTSNALGGLTLDNLDVSGFAQTGIVVSGGGSDFVAQVTDVSVSDSGATGTSGGTGGITFFEFLGDVAFDGVSVEGNSVNADHGIQIAGFRDSDDGIIAPIGTVTFTDTEVTGTFEKTLAIVQGYNDLAGLNFTGGLTLNGTATWTGLYVNPTFGSNVTPATAPSTVDLTGVNVTGGSYGTSPGFAQTGNAGVVVIGIGVDGTITGSDSDPNVFVGDAIVGTTANETINAGAGADLIYGGGGNDILNGGTGNDTFVTFVGDGADIIDGGSNGGGVDTPGDTLIVSNVFPGPVASPFWAQISIAADTTNGGIDVTELGSGETDDATGIENVSFILGDGGNSIFVSGDLAAQGVTSITVGPDPLVGSGAANDSLVALNLSSGASTVVSFTSGNGDDTFFTNAGAVANIFHAGETGETSGDTLALNSTTGPNIVNLNDTGGGQTATGFAELSGVENIAGSIGNDTVIGNEDDNRFQSNGGSDSFTGGAGTDEIVVNPARTVFTYAIAEDGEITLSQGAETISIANDVELLSFDQGLSPSIDLTNPVRLVDAAGSLVASFATIQAAVDSAGTTDGMTVQILGQAAAFAESINTNGKALTFEGVTINGNRAVIDPASGNGFTVTGNTGGGDVSFVNLDITGGADGIFVDDEANVGTLTIQDSNITDNTGRGLMVLGNTTVAEGAATVVIDDSTFSGNAESGINGGAQIKLFGFSGDATFTGVTLAGAATGTAIAARPDYGIEITGNVLNGSANNGGTPPNIGTINFADMTVTGAYHKNPVAIFNYAEIDGLTITDLDLSGAESDWGPLLNIDGITDSTIDASDYGITFPADYGIVSEIQGEKIGQADVDTTIIGTDADDRIHGKTGDDSLEGGAGDDQLYGAEKGTNGTFAEAGNDVLTGGAGDDYLNGGAETDTGAGTTAEGDVAVYIGSAGDQITTADLTSVTGTNPVGGASFAGVQVDARGLATNQGTDTLDNIEIIENRDAGGALISRILLVGDGGFGTLQAAIDEADAGDTIRIAAGTYAADATLDKALTIVGAQEGVVGTGQATGTGTVLQGTLRVTAATGDVVIDGIEFQNVSDDATGFDALELAGGADITVRNNLFFSTGVNADNDSFDKAIHVETGATGNVEITGNAITGAAAGGYSTASWNRGIYSDGNAASLDIDGNSFEFTRTAVNLDSYDDATTTVANNTVTSAGSGISVGVGSDSEITGLTDNTFNDVGTEFNLRNINTQVTFDAGTNSAENTVSAPVNPGDDFLTIRGGTVGDDLTGNDGADLIFGLDGDDTIDGQGGDDIILGGSGEDSLSGGEGADTVAGDADADNLFGNAGDDVLAGGAGADVMTGGAGADTLYGTDDQGDEGNMFVDTATYDAGAVITWNDVDGNWEVTTDGATDTLYGIEKVTVGTDTFLLVDDATGATAGGFSSVTEAEAAAVDGDTILVANGTYAGATLTKAVTVQGAGNAAGETVFSSGFTVDLVADGAGVTLRDFALENIAGTSIKAQDTEVLDALRIENVRVEGGSGSGLAVSGRKASDAYDQAGVQNVEIVNSDFIDNAQSSGNNGNIVLFEYDGDVEITNVTSSNAVTGTNSAAFLVQISGFDGPRYDQKTPGSGSSVGSYDVLTAMGSVVIDGLDISGNARKPGLYIQGFTNLTGLDITGSTVDVDSGWGTPVFIDPMADQSPLGTANTSANVGSFFDETSANASYDLSGLSVVQKSYQVEVSPGVFETRQQVVVVEGTSKSEMITGTNANDYFVGFGGDDVLNGAGGDDQFIFISGDGDDEIDGGDDTDALNVTGTASGDDMTVSDTAVSIVGGGSVTFENIENTSLSGEAGEDTFRFTDTSLTGGPVYAVNGGADADTLDFGGYDSGMTVSLVGQTFKQTGAAETHSVSNVENLDGSLFNDTLTGDNQANAINGLDGADIITGLNGSDTLMGGEGNDELYGGNGTDELYGGAGADFLNGGGGLDRIRYDSLGEGTDGLIFDLVIGYSTQDNDVFVINKAGFAGLGGEADGVLEAENFVSANIDEVNGGYAGFTPGEATFVFDDTGTNLSGNRELWYDAEGDGTAIKMLEFNSGSNLSGFDFSDFLLA